MRQTLFVLILFSVAPTCMAEDGWFAFDPKPLGTSEKSQIDLRFLNEKTAGEHGFIQARGQQFVFELTQQPVRFWAVNGPASKNKASLAEEARMLARYGVNLVRIHHAVFDEQGQVDLQQIEFAIDVVDAMKQEGIYTHFSIYFPLWMKPKPDWKWLGGYDGQKHPFAALYFNPDFQQRYRQWWHALLTTKSKVTGKSLIEEPAVMGLELINEDSFFFWTFSANNLPEEQLQMLEGRFANWLIAKYKSLDNVQKAWNGFDLPRDQPSQSRIGFRELWAIANQRTTRDQDTAEFLASVQRGFYQESYDYLRSLGVRSLITCSNWATASPQYLGPIEKYTYSVGDFLDRHGYFGCSNSGEASEWSIRDGHAFIERSALRFDSEDGKPSKQFVHPSMDPSYNDKPSMISETTWNRPNRYRSEAPLYFAAYGALQDSDAIVHFAKDGNEWSVKPNYFMQPWTLQSPAMMGQFPAAALLYRQGLVSVGDVVADVKLNTNKLLHLSGTPLQQDAAFDELRLRDVPNGTKVEQGNVLDPLMHYVGRTQVAFVDEPSSTSLQSLSQWIDRDAKLVRSTTNELELDYNAGRLKMNAPLAQGVSGNIGPKTIRLKDISVECDLDLAHIVVISLDGEDLSRSKKMFVQVMTEEKATGYKDTVLEGRRHRIDSIGQNPWLVRNFQGQIQFHRNDANKLVVQQLKQNGTVDAERPKKPLVNSKLELASDVVYYLITL